MSVDIAWEAITSGADGDALAESIRAFIHAKFQQITLPRFISSVQVHTFDFGSVCPTIEIKDICDPLPDFYEDDEDQDDVRPPPSNVELNPQNISGRSAEQNLRDSGNLNAAELQSRVAALQHLGEGATHSSQSLHSSGLTSSHARLGVHGPDQTPSELFTRSGTPGIPGGTANMSYFHFPMGGLSGAQTPLAAVVGGGAFGTHAWLRDQQSQRPASIGPRADPHAPVTPMDGEEFHTRTADSVSSPELGSPLYPSSPKGRPLGYMPAEKVCDDVSSSDALGPPVPPSAEKVSPSDLQVVARVTYTGDVHMTLTAEIMLDYPMPSFIKIPLKLSITGLEFDGVAILAYIRKKMHFCFLDAEDADTLIGGSFLAEESGAQAQAQAQAGKTSTIGSLLHEIQVETEIGRQESGKQVLKNVGKVERFVLEQVRRIFEEEFVFPSFWTFLV